MARQEQTVVLFKRGLCTSSTQGVRASEKSYSGFPERLNALSAPILLDCLSAGHCAQRNTDLCTFAMRRT